MEGLRGEKRQRKRNWGMRGGWVKTGLASEFSRKIKLEKKNIWGEHVFCFCCLNQIGQYVVDGGTLHNMVYKHIKVKHYIEESDGHGVVIMTPDVK